MESRDWKVQVSLARPAGCVGLGQTIKRALKGSRGRAGVQREYDAGGELLEVRSRTAVRGGWVGGRM